MEVGVLIDHSQGTYVRTIWVSGIPDTSIWVGLKLKGRERLEIVTYRCTRCGYLESYAPSPDAPENILLRPAQATESPIEADQLLRASQQDQSPGDR
jgi:hypothetical protein